ncbi:methylene-tetrahydrofolate dehydrogenase [Thermoplasma volcanium GSS1]|uniref:Bifunctional protein FolD n=1 Tax=Thermoplasma volcanium (strain ATCC 51530 / DSM 4299 / JCM 9571 / NBRC 15438 / GSS1) TaxID=273116 RepID=FOLD_THEVO|nr:bifunctional methylenetetrahydrofolate dehydrogenase/methenyltetrahydrofolate cyclohydrolase FolD [Thermoplasma volcanium]Q979W3.1 RecName: Full=Bifunctional protein FolD; Includes: RecName: Full=Methylenetetrahydrofolate dehydrogenase; Includes: RecName: Full=Methenyltetrahydrofolate cyclohydrolase [Thermoplasma volcanium GSS1]BAB60189.1 methylene-tetrahydrofolate dehydrogenase [Thermoplasma volcanium GSS1]
MAVKLLKGEEIAEKKAEELKERIEKMGVSPRLVLLQVGNYSAATIYARAKIKRGKKIGADVVLEKYEDLTKQELVRRIEELSADKDVNGIMVENPLPKTIDYYDIVKSIPYYKDVDALSPYNQGSIAINREFLVPATAMAVVDILKYYGYEKTTATIINRSPVVGRPLSMMMLNRDYTVSICHSKTPDIRSIAKASKIIVVAVGRPGFLDDTYVTESSVVIDVGINYVQDKVIGDIDFDKVSEKVEAVTPVPGGVGPITATNILSNLVKAAEYQSNTNIGR